MGRGPPREPMPITSVRKGMIVLYEGKYMDVKEWQPARSGRGAASYSVTYEELETGKEKQNKYSANTKMTKVETDRVECQVMYLTGTGKEEKQVVLADEDFNEVTLPLARFGTASVGEGSKVVMYTDGDVVVKVSVLPASSK
mmetsp:Transcript_103595/g.231433  ORF Transcript_103595/g.231433 Transcript_103595/m.231433 type:complete len:142 (-) Transcript_103595:55-480(-)